MTQKTLRKPVKDRMIDAALDLAREESWSNIDFVQICLAAEVDEDQALEFFDDKTDILVAYGRRIDMELRAIALEILSDEMSEREKLFDLLMERFELINDNREAILSILSSIKTDPKEAVLTFPHLAKSMTRILELAGLETEGFKGAAQVTGLTGVYLYTIRTWKEDETADLSKTMATLDKALDYAESSANSLLNGNLLSGLSDMCKNFANNKKEDH